MRALALAILLAATAASAEPKLTFHYQFRLSEPLALDIRQFYEQRSLAIPEIETLARSAASYEGFLEALQRRAPVLFENYVLLHGTGSVQPASETHPRVILFGDGLFLAFAEDPTKAERRVEILAFDRATYTFKTHELRFKPGTPVASESEPPVCATCHGTPTRPLWEPYDFWPGAYGSAISRYRSHDEKASYAAFFASARSGIHRLIDDHAVVDTGEHRVPSIETFTVYLANLNFLRVATELKAHKARLEPLKYALFATLRRCSDGSVGGNEDFASYFPPALFASARQTYDALLASTKAERSAFKAHLDRRYTRTFPSFEPLFLINHERLGREAVVAAQLRFILENAGLSMDGFPTSSGANRYLLSTPSNFGLDMLTALVHFDREGLQNAGATGGTSWATIDCARSKELSRTALASYSFPGAAAAAPQAAAPLGRCIRCHTIKPENAPGAPFLPFDDTMRLRTLLAERPGLKAAILARLDARGTGQMPPGAPLTTTERAAFAMFLDALTE